MQLSELQRRSPTRTEVMAQQSDEGLVVDVRSELKPAEQVERKLSRLLGAPKLPAARLSGRWSHS